LTFAYAEAQEIKKEFADGHATYDKSLTLLRSQLESLEQTTTSANASSSTATVPTNGSGNGLVNNNHTTATEPAIQSTNSSEYGVAWIMYSFGRRSEGVKSLRGIFGKARRDRWIGKYKKLLVCVFPFRPLSDLGIIILFFSTDGVSLL
jgi:cleavage stimulation factor subunit 3